MPLSSSGLDNNSWSSRGFCWFPFYCIRLYDHYYLSLKESPMRWLKQEERTISLEEAVVLSFMGRMMIKMLNRSICSLQRERPWTTLKCSSHSALCLLDVSVASLEPQPLSTLVSFCTLLPTESLQWGSLPTNTVSIKRDRNDTCS